MNTVYCKKCHRMVVPELNERLKTFRVIDIKVKAQVTLSYCPNCHREIYNKAVAADNTNTVFEIYRARKGYE